MAYKDPKKKKERDKAYHIANREKRNAYARQWHEKNREKLYITQKAWRDSHREHILQNKKEYYQKNREKILEREKERYNEKRGNPKYIAKHREYGRKHRQKIRDIVIAHYGGDSPHCMCCGETTLQFLTVHHINGDGAAHRRSIGNSGLYEWIIKHNYPTGLELQCWNCNLASYQYGICPHKIKEGDKF